MALDPIGFDVRSSDHADPHLADISETHVDRCEVHRIGLHAPIDLFGIVSTHEQSRLPDIIGHVKIYTEDVIDLVIDA